MKTITKTIKSLVVVATLACSSTLVASDGASLYKKCAGCHGANAEKVALGKSKVIANMSVDEITNALNGYKDGSYGGAMKGLMKGQVSKLSDGDVKSLATYIASMK